MLPTIFWWDAIRWGPTYKVFINEYGVGSLGILDYSHYRVRTEHKNENSTSNLGNKSISYCVSLALNIKFIMYLSL